MQSLQRFLYYFLSMALVTVSGAEPGARTWSDKANPLRFLMPGLYQVR